MRVITSEELKRFESGDIEKAKNMVCDVSLDPNNRRLTVPPERDDFDMLLMRVLVHADKAERMASLWKRCAKQYIRIADAAMKDLAAKDRILAAIEAEGMKINCPACGAEKTLLCGCWKKTP